jgi:hypothetical protein
MPRSGFQRTYLRFAPGIRAMVSYNGVPPTGDPSWEQRTAPLLQFLESSKTHKELEQWRREQRVPTHVMPHLLAWLEGKYRIYWNDDAKTWHKRFVAPLPKEVVVTKKKKGAV